MDDVFMHSLKCTVYLVLPYRLFSITDEVNNKIMIGTTSVVIRKNW